MSITRFLSSGKLLAAFLLLFGGSRVVWGQGGETLYAAPGMPVMLARRPPVRVAAKATPVMEPWLSSPLPRFWKSPDSLARQRDAKQLWQAMRQRVHYPKTALRSQVEGTIQIRVLIAPDGAPLSVSVFKAVFVPALPDSKASKELATEALRVAQLLRFQPKVGAVDTVTIPFSHQIQ